MRSFLIILSAPMAGMLSSFILVHAQNAPETVEQHRGNIANHQTVGDFAPTRELSCLSLQEVKNAYTPPDLLTGISQCVDNGDFDKAVRMYIVARAYVQFDKGRVADPTVEDANTILALRMTAHLSADQKQRLDQALAALRNDKQASHDFCTAADHLGPPDYYPEYLVMHGMGAFLPGFSRDKSLKTDFDAKRAWTNIETTNLRCGT